MTKRYPTFTEIEEAARSLRTKLGIDDLWCPDLISLFEEKLPALLPGLKFQPVPDEQLPHCEAETDGYERLIRIRYTTLHACLRGDPRARMTVAHELGHIVLGHPGTRYRQQSKSSARLLPREGRDESHAWQFARVFLAPTYLARQCSSAEEIAEKHGLSSEAADIRFAQLLPLINSGPEPSQRWKLTEARSKTETLATGAKQSEDKSSGNVRQNDRPLTAKAIDFLQEAQRRGHRITSLRKRGDDD